MQSSGQGLQDQFFFPDGCPFSKAVLVSEYGLMLSNGNALSRFGNCEARFKAN